MEKTNGNDLVNPAWIDCGIDDRGYTHSGLTKREHFAAMAMQGLMAVNDKGQIDWENGVISAAQISVQAADALIAELNKPNPSQP